MKIQIEIKEDDFLYSIHLHENCNHTGKRKLTYEDVSLFGQVQDSLTSRICVEDKMKNIIEDAIPLIMARSLSEAEGVIA